LGSHELRVEERKNEKRKGKGERIGEVG